MKIGPHFAFELEQASLLGLPFAWSEDGTVEYGVGITPAQKAAIQAVIAAHNPLTPAPDIDIVRDAYVEAKAALTAFAADSTLAKAKPAILKLGLCVEELLKALNRRIS